MTTGLPPDDPGFRAEWEDFLRKIGDLLQPDRGAPNQD